MSLYFGSSDKECSRNVVYGLLRCRAVARNSVGQRTRCGFFTASLIDCIEGGLPVESLERLANSLAPGDITSIYNVIPKAALNRRKAQADNKLSADEGAKVTRIAKVWSAAVDVWKSEEKCAYFSVSATCDDRG